MCFMLLKCASYNVNGLQKKTKTEEYFLLSKTKKL